MAQEAADNQIFKNLQTILNQAKELQSRADLQAAESKDFVETKNLVCYILVSFGYDLEELEGLSYDQLVKELEGLISTENENVIESHVPANIEELVDAYQKDQANPQVKVEIENTLKHLERVVEIRKKLNQAQVPPSLESEEKEQVAQRFTERLQENPAAITQTQTDQTVAELNRRWQETIDQSQLPQEAKIYWRDQVFSSATADEFSRLLTQEIRKPDKSPEETVAAQERLRSLARGFTDHPSQEMLAAINNSLDEEVAAHAANLVYKGLTLVETEKKLAEIAALSLAKEAETIAQSGELSPDQAVNVIRVKTEAAVEIIAAQTQSNPTPPSSAITPILVYGTIPITASVPTKNPSGETLAVKEGDQAVIKLLWERINREGIKAGEEGNALALSNQAHELTALGATQQGISPQEIATVSRLQIKRLSPNNPKVKKINRISTEFERFQARMRERLGKTRLAQLASSRKNALLKAFSVPKTQIARLTRKVSAPFKTASLRAQHWLAKTALGKGFNRIARSFGQKSLQTLWAAGKSRVAKTAAFTTAKGVLAKLGLGTVATSISGPVGTALVLALPVIKKYLGKLVGGGLNTIKTLGGISNTVLSSFTGGQYRPRKDKTLSGIAKTVFIALLILIIFSLMPFTGPLLMLAGFNKAIDIASTTTRKSIDIFEVVKEVDRNQIENSDKNRAFNYSVKINNLDKPLRGVKFSDTYTLIKKDGTRVPIFPTSTFPDSSYRVDLVDRNESVEVLNYKTTFDSNVADSLIINTVIAEAQVDDTVIFNKMNSDQATITIGEAINPNIQCNPPRHLAEEVICKVSKRRAPCNVIRIIGGNRNNILGCLDSIEGGNVNILKSSLTSYHCYPSAVYCPLQCLQFVVIIQSALGVPLQNAPNASFYYRQSQNPLIKEIAGATVIRPPQLPVSGDIAIWSGNFYNPDGHIAIVLGTIGDAKIVVAETNIDLMGKLHVGEKPAAGFPGGPRIYLRPK